MKILHVNISDVYGGASRAAYRLHHGLRSFGEDSRMLVQEHTVNDPAVIGPRTPVGKQVARLKPYIDPIILKYIYGGARTVFSPAWFPFSNVVNEISRINPDIVHLHWVCGGVLRPSDIALLNKPIVWTLHDMWPFTGGCHYSDGCDRYSKNCGCCPQLYRNGEGDISHALFNRKREAWSSVDLTVISPSHWLAECARKSSLFGSRRIKVIHYCVDIDQYKPIDRKIARKQLDLSEDKKLVLYGAINATGDHRKGFDLLHQALDTLLKTTRQDIELVVFGNEEPVNLPKFGVRVKYLGKINDDDRLVAIYSAVDLMVVPSREDNLPNTVLESIACGTPVAAFNVGGIPDMVIHKSNGYLAAPFDTGDLANGIEWILADKARHSDLRKQARERAKTVFNSRAIAMQYQSLYQEVMK